MWDEMWIVDKMWNVDVAFGHGAATPQRLICCGAVG